MALTELAAVNQMLSAIDEEGVSALGSGIPDAAAAEILLDAVKSDVLAMGWLVNTRTKTLTKDGNNRFVVAGSALSIDTEGHSAHINVVQRDGYLVDVANDTDVWTTGSSTIRVKIVYDIAFESLPHTLRSYIAARASREFQNDEIGSSNLEAKISRKETQLWASALSDRTLVADENPLRGQGALAHGIYRNNRIYGT